MTKEQKALLELVNIGAGGECLFSTDVMDADWSELFELAQEQGVVGVAWHGLELLYKNGVDKCPADVKLQWYGANKQRAIAVKDKKQLCMEFVEKLGIPCVVLKGLDYCRFWPEESLREFGDLDIWPMPKEDSRFKIQDSGEHKSNYDIVNQRIEEIGGKRIDNGYYKHSEWMYKDLMVENHQFLTKFDGTRSGKILEKAARSWVNEGQKQIADNVLVPGYNFTALYILLHAHQHFFHSGMSIKQILDWHFFLKMHENDVDWGTVIDVMEQAKVRGMFDIMTAFCVKYLGLKTKLPYVLNEEKLSQFNDVLFSTEYAGSKLSQLICRFRRMWRFREFNGANIFVRIINTYRFNFRHKLPELE